MTEQPPNLPTLDELAEEFQALRPHPQPVFHIQLLASCWHSELVVEALDNAMYALYQFQERMADTEPMSPDLFKERLKSFRKALGLRDSGTVTLYIQQHRDRCYWDCDLVPRALELPLAAKWSAELLHSAQYQGMLEYEDMLESEAEGMPPKGIRQYEGILAIGVFMQGDTPDFEPVARECAAELRAVALQNDIPVISGLVAAADEQQAKEQVGQAEYWVRSLLQMMLLQRRLAP